LDYGMAAFYDSTHLYQPFLYDDYIGKRPARPLHTGALDLFEIIKSVYFLTERKPPNSELYEIHQLVTRWMNQFSLFFRDGSTPIENWITYLPKVGIRRFYLLDLLLYVEQRQSGENRRILHEYHITQLQRLTPRFIMNTFFPRIFNWEFINQHVELVQRAGLFDIPAIVPRAVVAPAIAAAKPNVVTEMVARPNIVPAMVDAIHNVDHARPNVAPVAPIHMKACGPKQGENRWTRPELVQMARARGINPNQKLDNLCRALGLPEAVPVAVPAAVPVAVKACGPKKGENRWTRPELIKLARARGINHNQSLNELCRALGLPPVPVAPIPVAPIPIAPVQLSPVQLSPIPIAPIPVAQIPVAQIPVAPVPIAQIPLAPVPIAQIPVAPVKVCGPKQGENRWTKPELIKLARESGINPNQSLDKLCKELHLPNRIGCMCDAIIASGKKKGQRCNRPCTHGTRCGLH
jgi:hypothetical protein